MMKRGNDFDQYSSSGDAKKARGSTDAGDLHVNLESGKVCTRILTNQRDISKVIGRGGAIISQIRSSCNVFIKNIDLDGDTRLLVIFGTPSQVCQAFDQAFECIHQNNPNDVITNVLVEHNKAGMLVGSKGVIIQNLKNRSGCHHIRMQKDVIDIYGVELRQMTIEGHVNATKRAHAIMHELCNSEREQVSGHQRQSQQQQQNVYAPPSVAPAPMQLQPIPTTIGPLPFHELVKVGVQAETVRQLTEMKSYLAQHFGLDLVINAFAGSLASTILQPIVSNIAPVVTQSAPYNTSSGGGSGSDSSHYDMRPQQQQYQHQSGSGGSSSNYNSRDSNRDRDRDRERDRERDRDRDRDHHRGGSSSGGRNSGSRDETFFSIPRAAAGIIIGKSGQGLKDLQNEYNVKIFVDKDLNNTGMRNVAITHGNPDTRLKCQRRIIDVVNDMVNQQSQLNLAAGAPNIYNHQAINDGNSVVATHTTVMHDDGSSSSNVADSSLYITPIDTTYASVDSSYIQQQQSSVDE